MVIFLVKRHAISNVVEINLVTKVQIFRNLCTYIHRNTFFCTFRYLAKIKPSFIPIKPTIS